MTWGAALLGAGFAVLAAIVAVVVSSRVAMSAPRPSATVSVVAAPDTRAPDARAPDTRAPDASDSGAAAPDAAAQDTAGPSAAGWADAAGSVDPAASAGMSGRDAAASVSAGARVVCTRMVPDAQALHAALLTAPDSATAVLCVRGSDGQPVAVNAVAFARAALGTPYVWGGNGRSDGGFDCSGLTAAAYASAGLHLPRTAQTQYNAVPKLSSGDQPQAGDLVFFGAGPRRITHVGIAVSATEMINAPQTGEVVKVAPLRRKDLVGIGRPSSIPGSDPARAAD